MLKNSYLSDDNNYLESDIVNKTSSPKQKTPNNLNNSQTQDYSENFRKNNNSNQGKDLIINLMSTTGDNKEINGDRSQKGEKIMALSRTESINDVSLEELSEELSKHFGLGNSNSDDEEESSRFELSQNNEKAVSTTTFDDEDNEFESNEMSMASYNYLDDDNDSQLDMETQSEASGYSSKEIKKINNIWYSPLTHINETQKKINKSQRRNQGPGMGHDLDTDSDNDIVDESDAVIKQLKLHHYVSTNNLSVKKREDSSFTMTTSLNQRKNKLHSKSYAYLRPKGSNSSLRHQISNNNLPLFSKRDMVSNTEKSNPSVLLNASNNIIKKKRYSSNMDRSHSVQSFIKTINSPTFTPVTLSRNTSTTSFSTVTTTTSDKPYDQNPTTTTSAATTTTINHLDSNHGNKIYSPSSSFSSSQQKSSNSHNQSHSNPNQSNNHSNSSSQYSSPHISAATSLTQLMNNNPTPPPSTAASVIMTNFNKEESINTLNSNENQFYKVLLKAKDHILALGGKIKRTSSLRSVSKSSSKRSSRRSSRVMSRRYSQHKSKRSSSRIYSKSHHRHYASSNASSIVNNGPNDNRSYDFYYDDDEEEEEFNTLYTIADILDDSKSGDDKSTHHAYSSHTYKSKTNGNSKKKTKNTSKDSNRSFTSSVKVTNLNNTRNSFTIHNDRHRHQSRSRSRSRYRTSRHSSYSSSNFLNPHHGGSSSHYHQKSYQNDISFNNYSASIISESSTGIEIDDNREYGIEMNNNNKHSGKIRLYGVCPDSYYGEYQEPRTPSIGDQSSLYDYEDEESIVSVSDNGILSFGLGDTFNDTYNIRYSNPKILTESEKSQSPPSTPKNEISNPTSISNINETDNDKTERGNEKSLKKISSDTTITSTISSSTPTITNFNYLNNDNPTTLNHNNNRVNNITNSPSVSTPTTTPTPTTSNNINNNNHNNNNNSTTSSSNHKTSIDTLLKNENNLNNQINTNNTNYNNNQTNTTTTTSNNNSSINGSNSNSNSINNNNNSNNNNKIVSMNKMYPNNLNSLPYLNTKKSLSNWDEETSSTYSRLNENEYAYPVEMASMPDKLRDNGRVSMVKQIPIAYFRYGVYMFITNPVIVQTRTVIERIFSAHTLYAITVKLLRPNLPMYRNSQICTFVVHKRYRQFRSFYKEIHKKYRSTITDWPEFPKKTFFDRLDPDIIKNRAEAFSALMSFISLHPMLHDCPVLLTFLEITGSGSHNLSDLNINHPNGNSSYENGLSTKTLIKEGKTIPFEGNTNPPAIPQIFGGLGQRQYPPGFYGQFPQQSYYESGGINFGVSGQSYHAPSPLLAGTTSSTRTTPAPTNNNHTNTSVEDSSSLTDTTPKLSSAKTKIITNQESNKDKTTSDKEINDSKDTNTTKSTYGDNKKLKEARDTNKNKEILEKAQKSVDEDIEKNEYLNNYLRTSIYVSNLNTKGGSNVSKYSEIGRSKTIGTTTLKSYLSNNKNRDYLNKKGKEGKENNVNSSNNNKMATPTLKSKIPVSIIKEDQDTIKNKNPTSSTSIIESPRPSSSSSSTSTITENDHGSEFNVMNEENKENLGQSSNKMENIDSTKQKNKNSEIKMTKESESMYSENYRNAETNSEILNESASSSTQEKPNNVSTMNTNPPPVILRPRLPQTRPNNPNQYRHVNDPNQLYISHPRYNYNQYLKEIPEIQYLISEFPKLRTTQNKRYSSLF